MKFGRKRGLTKEAQKKARLAAEYYRDETKQLSILEIMKLVDIKSKPTLYSYLEYMGRRNCKICKVMFWDKEQEPKDAYCLEHLGDREEEKIMSKIIK